MLLIQCESLKQGMTLARPVYHPLCENCMLLSDGVALTSAYIRRLNELEVTHAWIAVPGFEEVDDKISSEISANHMELFTALNSSMNTLERRVEVKLNLQQYRRAVSGMLSNIVLASDHDVITNQLATCGSMLVGHMSNCCYLSLLIGAHMTGYLQHERATLPAHVAKNTTELGVGALLHDIGKMQMPDDLQKVSVLDEESQWPEYRFHVRAGHDMTHEHLSVLASNTILNHHQRYDGTGFPARASRNPQGGEIPLSGRQIHVFSRILAVVDVFDHLLCPNGGSVPTIVAIHGLKKNKLSGWFDPVVVETLLRLVPPFQLGTVVTLTDGNKGVVIQNHPEAPCKPTIRLVRESLDSAVQAGRRELDLRMCRNIGVGEVDGVDVRNYIFSGELEPSLPG